MTHEMDHMTYAVQESTRLSQNGEPLKAMELLDSSIVEAIRENWNHALPTISRHAAIIAESSGDLARAKFYNEQTLAYAPDNPMALYGMAKILSQQGEIELARQYASRCYEASLRGGTEIDRARVELLGKHWPEFGVWRVDG
jgi:tetratricopeptide (TPR) repeat protein